MDFRRSTCLARPRATARALAVSAEGRTGSHWFGRSGHHIVVTYASPLPRATDVIRTGSRKGIRKTCARDRGIFLKPRTPRFLSFRRAGSTAADHSVAVSSSTLHPAGERTDRAQAVSSLAIGLMLRGLHAFGSDSFRALKSRSPFCPHVAREKLLRDLSLRRP